MNEQSSAENRGALAHWRQQLLAAFEAGKTVFFFLTAPEEVYARTGTVTTSGTGRNQKIINYIDSISNYDSLPLKFDSLTPGIGEKVKLTKDGALIAPYWSAMDVLSKYEVCYEHTKSVPLMVTKSGNLTVASICRGKGGAFVMLPAISFDRKEFTKRDEGREVWTKDALACGREFVIALLEIHKNLRRPSRGPAPSWVSDEAYCLQIENNAAEQLAKIEEVIAASETERRGVEKSLEAGTLPKALLYETGKTLEAAVISALRTLGFTADNFTDTQSEFDIVFTSAEGRFLGECEGRDSSAIAIDKLQQLERNIQEDFAKPGINEYAKGVLFGNPHRLVKPEERKDLFTAKALEAAGRTSTVLVHTADLFPIVRYLSEVPDAEYAKSVRECFQQGGGKIVKFPPVPKL